MTEVAIQQKETALAEPVSPIWLLIERATFDPNFDPDKLERLMAMKERSDAELALQAFNRAMTDAQAEMPAVFKNKNNDQTGSRYANLERVMAVIQPVLTKHGFSISFGTDQSDLAKHYGVTCRLAHVAGHVQDYRVDIPSDGAGIKGQTNKTATHAFGSSMSYARRYLLMMVFNVATSDDDDGNAADGEFITPKQISELQEGIDSCGADIMKFCKAMGVGALAEIPAANFGRANRMIGQKRAQLKQVSQ